MAGFGLRQSLLNHLSRGRKKTSSPNLFFVSLEGYFRDSDFTDANSRQGGEAVLAVWHQQEGEKGVLERGDLPSSTAMLQVEPLSACGAAAQGPPPALQLEAAAGGEILLHRQPWRTQALLPLHFPFYGHSFLRSWLLQSWNVFPPEKWVCFVFGPPLHLHTPL